MQPQIKSKVRCSDGVAGEVVVVLLSGEPLLLGRRRDAPVDHQRGGGVVVEGGDPENGGQPRLISLPGRARAAR